VQVNISNSKQIEASTLSMNVSEGSKEAKAALEYTF
jgi:hypothetical protein